MPVSYMYILCIIYVARDIIKHATDLYRLSDDPFDDNLSLITVMLWAAGTAHINVLITNNDHLEMTPLIYPLHLQVAAWQMI